MICPNCQSMNRDDSHFCIHCGYRLLQSNSTLQPGKPSGHSSQAVTVFIITLISIFLSFFCCFSFYIPIGIILLIFSYTGSRKIKDSFYTASNILNIIFIIIWLLLTALIIAIVLYSQQNGGGLGNIEELLKGYNQGPRHTPPSR